MLSSFTVSLAVGFGAGAGGAFAFTTPDGRCNTQSFTTAQGATSAFGPGTANVNGAVDTEAGCAGVLTLPATAVTAIAAEASYINCFVNNFKKEWLNLFAGLV